MINYIHTLNGISVVLKGRPYHIAPSDPQFTNILVALKNHEDEEFILDIVNLVQRKVEEAARLSPNMIYNGGIVKYKGMPLRGYAVDRLVAFIHTGQDTKPLSMFLDKLQSNPSRQTIENLYEFLEHGMIPITERGTFLAYKAIRQDWMDIHSATFDNSIGAVLEMPRNMVDDNRDRTCSSGFHVCSFEYLPHFAHADGHVVICEVDPADVVSIPSDYNNTKMRVSKYKVIGEVEGYYKDRKNILSDNEIWGEDYVLFAREFDTDEWEEVDGYLNKEEAIEGAKEELLYGGEGEEDWTEVKIVQNGVTVYRQIKE